MFGLFSAQGENKLYLEINDNGFKRLGMSFTGY